MLVFLILFIHVVILPFKTKARLEAEIIMLRHQLNVLRRRSARDDRPVASSWLPLLLALEVARSRRPAKVPIKIQRLIRELSLANRLLGCAPHPW